MTTVRKWMVGLELGVFAFAVSMSVVTGNWLVAALASPVLALAVWDTVRA